MNPFFKEDRGNSRSLIIFRWHAAAYDRDGKSISITCTAKHPCNSELYLANSDFQSTCQIRNHPYSHLYLLSSSTTNSRSLMLFESKPGNKQRLKVHPVFRDSLKQAGCRWFRNNRKIWVNGPLLPRNMLIYAMLLFLEFNQKQKKPGCMIL